MSLEKLNEDLHSRESHLERARRPEEPSHSPEETQQEALAFQKTETWQRDVLKDEIYIVNPGAKRRKKIIIWGVAFFFLGLFAAGGIYAWSSFALKKESVVLGIEGPQNVASAEEVSYTITYRNTNRMAIKDATLYLSFPGSFRPEESGTLKITGLRAEQAIGDVASGGSGQLTVSGKFFGSKGEKGNIGATLRYSSGSTSGVFENTSELQVTVASSPITFEIAAPTELASAQELEYIVSYSNQSTETFNNLRIRLSYPEEFQYLRADPAPSTGETEWYIGSLAPKASGKIVVRGVLSGGRDQYKKIRGEIGILQGDSTLLAYSESERQTKMIASPLSITQSVNDKTGLTVLPGDTLRYTIRYKNDGNIGLRDVIITQSIDTTYLDISRLSLQKGAYDASQKKIVWRASDIPELARMEPGASGEITFSIPVLRQFALGENAEKNIVIRSLATIDSPDIPAILVPNKMVGSNLLLIKLGALVALNVSALYTDTVIPNSGPVPPVVGQETTYTLRVRLENSSSDITSSRVIVALPSGVVYKGKSSPEGMTLGYNARTNELVWEIGTLSPGSPKELAFQVGITPNQSQVGKPVTLVTKTIFRARDAFASRDVYAERGEVNNSVNDDPNPNAQNGTVKGN